MAIEEKCSPESFFKRLYKNADSASVLTISTINKQGLGFKHFKVDQLELMLSYGKQNGLKTDTYFNVNPLKNGVNNRGKVEDVSQIVALWADYDIKHPVAHKQTNLPESKEVVLNHLQNLIVPPTVAFHTGYGIDAFWILKKPFEITDKDSLEIGKAGVCDFGTFLMSCAQKDGFVIDNVFDLCRMLRFPESKNFKVKEQPSEGYFIFYDGPEYEWEEIQSLVGDCSSISPSLDVENVNSEVSTSPALEEETADLVVPSGFDPEVWGPSDRISQKCAAIKYMIEHPSEQTEPMWYAASTNAICAPDGEAWFHSISKDYPGYSPEETNQKLENAKKGKKVCSCSFFRKMGAPCPECGCKVHFPYELAKYTEQDQIEKLLSLNLPLSLDTVMADKTLSLMKTAKLQYPMLYAKFKMMIKDSKLNTKDFEYSLNHYIPKIEGSVPAERTLKSLHLANLPLGGALVPDSYDVSMEKGIILWCTGSFGENRAVEVCPEPIVVSAVTENVDDGHMEMELTFFKNHKWAKVQIPPSVAFSKNQILNLANEGISVTSTTASLLVDYIYSYKNANKAVIPVIRSINRIGWMSKYQEFFPYYNTEKVIYEDKEQSLVSALYSKGNVEKWLEVGNKIRRNSFARCLLDASFASVLVPVIRNRIILLHIWHNSRSGKTAALKFALSVWGDPNVLMGNFHSTAVGLERKAGILKNLPLGVDELQEKSKTLDSAMIVYQLGNGQGKTRGSKNGGLQETLNWENAVITTGEQTLSSESSMDGVTNRAIEIYGAPFDSADMGREVHRIAAENFGFAGRQFIEYLIRCVFANKDQVNGDYEKIRDTLKQRFDALNKGDAGSHLDNVALMSLADYYSTLCIFHQYLKEPCLFDTEEEAAFSDAIDQGLAILTNLKEQEKDDSITRAWNCVRDWVGANRRNFSAEAVPCLGRFEPDKKQTLINATQLRDALNKAGFDPNKSFRGFAERGLIETHVEGKYKDRFQKAATIYGISMRVIVANICCDSCDLARQDFYTEDGRRIEPLV